MARTPWSYSRYRIALAVAQILQNLLTRYTSKLGLLAVSHESVEILVREKFSLAAARDVRPTEKLLSGLIFRLSRWRLTSSFHKATAVFRGCHNLQILKDGEFTTLLHDITGGSVTKVYKNGACPSPHEGDLCGEAVHPALHEVVPRRRSFAMLPSGDVYTVWDFIPGGVASAEEWPGLSRALLQRFSQGLYRQRATSWPRETASAFSEFERATRSGPDQFLAQRSLQAVRRSLELGDEIVSAIVHGDFLRKNVRIARNGPVVLDWDWSAPGPVLSDLTKARLDALSSGGDRAAVAHEALIAEAAILLLNSQGAHFERQAVIANIVAAAMHNLEMEMRHGFRTELDHAHKSLLTFCLAELESQTTEVV